MFKRIHLLSYLCRSSIIGSPLDVTISLRHFVFIVIFEPIRLYFWPLRVLCWIIKKKISGCQQLSKWGVEVSACEGNKKMGKTIEAVGREDNVTEWTGLDFPVPQGCERQTRDRLEATGCEIIGAPMTLRVQGKIDRDWWCLNLNLNLKNKSLEPKKAIHTTVVLMSEPQLDCWNYRYAVPAIFKQIFSTSPQSTGSQSLPRPNNVHVFPRDPQ